MSYDVYHISVDGAGLSRRNIPDLETAKATADDFQRSADLSGIDCWCDNEGCRDCHGEGFIHNPWRYEYAVAGHGRFLYRTRSLT